MGRFNLSIAVLLWAVFIAPAGVWANEFAAGRVTLNAPVGGGGTPSFTSVNFRQSYSTPPLVFVVNSNQATSESNVRIRNVTTTGFEIAHVFPDNSIATYPDLDIDYLAIEAGTHTLGGSTLVAGFIDTQRFQSKLIAGDTWQTVAFGTTFAAVPGVITQIQGMANETSPNLSTPSSPWMEVAVRNVSTTQLDLALERAETTTGSITSNERIAYLAMASGTTGNFNDSGATTINFEALRSADNVTQNCTAVGLSAFSATPLVIASNNKRDGADGSWARVCSKSSTNVLVKVQEDIATDADTNHTTEAMGVFAVSQAFHAGVPQIGFGFEADSLVITGTTSGSLAFATVTFASPFDSVPRIFALPTNEEAEPASLRIKNVSVNGFQIAQVQPSGELGGAESMTVDYIAAIDGRHYLDDSTPVDVGVISTSATQFTAPVTGTASWDTINFATTFATPPVVLLQIQGLANEPGLNPSNVSVPWLEVASQAVTTSSIQVALERAESAPGTVSSPEQVAYLAVPPNITGSFQIGFTTIAYESQRFNGIQGVDNGCFSNNFLGSYGSAPVAVASQYQRNGNNGGWVKRCSISAAAIGLQIDEDRSNDTERAHIDEEAHLFALSQTFIGDFPKPVLMVLKNASGVANANPGDTLTYQIQVTNTGANSGYNILMDDRMPLFTGLVLDAYGAGTPFNLIDGVPSSGLSLGTPTYSQDNGVDGYAYTPGATGVDNTITDWRIPMTGVMPTNGNFTLQYQAVVQ